VQVEALGHLADALADGLQGRTLSSLSLLLKIVITIVIDYNF
jgi:hypothetical protein